MPVVKSRQEENACEQISTMDRKPSIRHFENHEHHSDGIWTKHNLLQIWLNLKSVTIDAFSVINFAVSNQIFPKNHMRITNHITNTASMDMNTNKYHKYLKLVIECLRIWGRKT